MKAGTLFLLLSALVLSAVSAYYSIVGLAAIFSAAWISVVILAGTLEVCKLVLASWLYRNWHQTHLALRAYLTSAVVVLMLITSLGIFGYLSRAHIEQTVANHETQLRIEQIEGQIAAKQTAAARYQRDLEQLDRSINIQLDANRAQTALAARRQQQAERDKLRSQLDTVQAETLQLKEQRTQLRSQQNMQNSKLGPIVYVIELFGGDSSDNQGAVKYIILVLVLVCDPLAVLMIVAANSNMVRQQKMGALGWNEEKGQMMFWNGQTWQAADFRLGGGTTEPGDLRPLQESLQRMAALIQEAHSNREEALSSLKVQFESAQQQLSAKIDQLQQQPPVPEPTPSLTPEEIKQAVNNSLEEWLRSTLSVSYTADSREIQDIVDRAIVTSLAKVQQEPPPATSVNSVPAEPQQEILDSHRGHAIKTQ